MLLYLSVYQVYVVHMKASWNMLFTSKLLLPKLKPYIFNVWVFVIFLYCISLKFASYSVSIYVQRLVRIILINFDKGLREWKWYQSFFYTGLRKRAEWMLLFPLQLTTPKKNIRLANLFMNLFKKGENKSSLNYNWEWWSLVSSVEGSFLYQAQPWAISTEFPIKRLLPISPHTPFPLRAPRNSNWSLNLYQPKHFPPKLN